jgi:ABC-2 type transport system permease protein
MVTIGVLFKNQRRLARAWLRQANWATAVVAAVFLAIGAAVMAGAYWFFLHAFGILLADDLAGAVIARYVIEAALALIFTLGVMSFIVSSLSTLFAPSEMRFLVALPARPATLFAHRFIGAAHVASWPVFVIGLPAVLAMGVSLGAGTSFYLFAVAVLALFTLFIAEVGAVLSFILAALAARLSRPWLWFGECVLFLAAIIALLRRILPRSLFTTFFVYDPGQASAAWDRIGAIFSTLPSHWFADVFSLALPGAPAGNALALVGAIAAALVVVAVALIILASAAYLPIWQSSEEGGFVAKPEDAARRPRLAPFPRIFRYRHGFLVEREALGLLRSSEDMSRAGFLLMLLLLYLMAMGALGGMEEFDGLNATILAFAFVSIGYFAFTFAMRFVFPSISLEGRAAWTLWTAPVHIHEIFTAKLFFWSAAVGLPTVLTALLASLLLGLAAPMIAMFLISAVCASATVVAVALGQGAVSPNFRERSPDALTTSPAGLAATAVGLAYLLVLGRYIHRFSTAYLSAGRLDVASVFGVLVVSIAVVGIYWIVAPRAMERAEIP